MPRTTIRRHGDRWALYEGDDEMPRAEYGTREEALLAGGDDAEVDDTPARRGPRRRRGRATRTARVRNRDAGIDQRTGGAGLQRGHAAGAPGRAGAGSKPTPAARESAPRRQRWER